MQTRQVGTDSIHVGDIVSWHDGYKRVQGRVMRINPDYTMTVTHWGMVFRIADKALTKEVG